MSPAERWSTEARRATGDETNRKRDKNMRTSFQLFLLSALSTLSAAAAAAEGATSAGPAPVDTSKWKCSLCKFEDGLSGTVDVGVGYVSDDSAKFGEYNGLHKRGAYLIGDGTARSRGADGTYWNVDASNLGLDSRSLGVEGGQQGKYRLIFKYDGLPHFISDSARTPFIGSGSGSLTLPAGYPAPSTGLMPLAGTLQPVDLATRRKRFGLGASWIPAQDWEYAVNFRHEVRDGTKRTAGAFFFNAAQLVEPVDYVTDQLDASASYTGRDWQMKFAYYGSLFRNGIDALTWQNPFTPVLGGVTGQLALPPDNQFHQISGSVGYQFSARTRASADVAVGRMTQNETFLASPVALPAISLDGRADTLNANVKLTSAVTDQLRLNAAYIRDDRDNQTPQAAYPFDPTVSTTAGTRVNLPYSFTQDRFKLSADYRFSALTRASAGFDYDEHKRTFQEVDKTREGTVWGKIAARPIDKLDMTFKLAHGERENSGYRQVAVVFPPENPLLRKFNMANRTRDSGGLRLDIAATETVNIGLGVDASKDDYTDSTIGLTSGREVNVNGDVSVLLTEQTSLHLFANRATIKSKQLGSQTFSTPDWSAENNDTIDVIGIGVKHAAIKDKLDIGADYTYTRSRSEITVDAGGSDRPFPDLSTRLHSLKLYATYRLKDSVSLLAGYWYEHYDSKNWMLDGVTPGTIPNVLTFGELPPRYNVHVMRLSVRYRF